MRPDPGAPGGNPRCGQPARRSRRRSSAAGHRERGYAIGRELATLPDLSAVFVANDEMAIGLLRAFAEAGRRVPDDVSVVGFDDLPVSGYTVPPLTTVRQDFDELGRRAVARLAAVVSPEAAPSPVTDELMPALIVRASTAARRGREDRK